mmetsp:Transcript_86859/g.186066  ORF Transcript_86859/g.186066 Transcript_86859/m.186066 type:complete len:200 (-) Transcript_86859:379-978(-)
MDELPQDFELDHQAGCPGEAGETEHAHQHDLFEDFIGLAVHERSHNKVEYPAYHQKEIKSDPVAFQRTIQANTIGVKAQAQLQGVNHQKHKTQCIDQHGDALALSAVRRLDADGNGIRSNDNPNEDIERPPLEKFMHPLPRTIPLDRHHRDATTSPDICFVELNKPLLLLFCFFLQLEHFGQIRGTQAFPARSRAFLRS